MSKRVKIELEKNAAEAIRETIEEGHELKIRIGNENEIFYVEKMLSDEQIGEIENKIMEYMDQLIEDIDKLLQEEE